jgi:glycosyltransferase involved in cell wall biosynthesis
MKALVSVIIPCYNAERWVGDAIQSCLSQTYRPIEVIVIDDGSTDGSRQIVLEAARSSHGSVKLIEIAHRGAPVARNRGLAAAAGDYVQFLDADDLMSPRKIELQAAAAAEAHEFVPCGPWLWLRQSNGRWTTEQPAQLMRCTGNIVLEWLRGAVILAHCFLWPRKVLEELRGWDESLSIWQDCDLFIRAVFNRIQFCFVPESVVFYRNGHSANSVSCSRTLDSLKCRIRVLHKVQAGLESRGDLGENRGALARIYYALAREFALDYPDEARKCFAQFLELSPDGRVPGTLANHVATHLLGVVRKERLAQSLKPLLRNGHTQFQPTQMIL